MFLILDLDDTLISTEYIGEKKIIHKRPYLYDFLDYASSKFTLVLFSAGTKSHVDFCLEKIDSKNKYFQTILTRENCIRKKGRRCIKNPLDLVENTSTNNFILIDDKLPPEDVFFFSNAIQILPFNMRFSDKELLTLILVLENILEIMIQLNISLLEAKRLLEL